MNLSKKKSFVHFYYNNNRNDKKSLFGYAKKIQLCCQTNKQIELPGCVKLNKKVEVNKTTKYVDLSYINCMCEI